MVEAVRFVGVVYKTFVILLIWEKYCTFALQIFEQFTIRIIP